MSGGEVAGVSAAKSVWAACYSCRDYVEHRRETLAPFLAAKARREGRDVIPVVDEFMLAAHDRHLDGTPLRNGGPTRITDPLAGRLLATYALLGSMVSDHPEATS